MQELQDPAGAPLISASDEPTAAAPEAGAVGDEDRERGTPHRTVTVAERRRLFVLLTAIAVVSYVADQLTKLLAVAHLSDGVPRPVVGDFLRLQLIRNPGAAFSMGTGSTWVLTVIAVVVLVVVVRFSRRLGSRGWAWAFGLLLGGALGNLTDRLVREPGFGRGHVVDFIDYDNWFIGNVADIAIVAAALLIALLALLGVGVDGGNERDRRTPDA